MEGRRGERREGEGEERCSFKGISNKLVSYPVLCSDTPAVFQCV